MYKRQGKWKGEGGGVLIDQTIHTIDMVQWLVNSRVKSVHGHIDHRALQNIEVEDVADAIIEFENGVRYSLFACNYNSYNAPIAVSYTHLKWWICPYVSVGFSTLFVCVASYPLGFVPSGW